jgi:3-hydroxypropanoate dehydrogenase
MSKTLNDAGWDLLFRNARTYNGWQDRPIPTETLKQLYDLLKWAPTSFNCQPARFVFVVSEEAKARLKPHMIPSNAEKTMKAPACVIVAYDTKFYEHLPKNFPAYDAKPLFEGNAELADITAKRNGSLQGGYLILAARGLGLDCGPMSGFNPAGVDAEFFPDGRYKSNFLCNIGYGTDEDLYPRGPRFEFEEACQIL